MKLPKEFESKLHEPDFIRQNIRCRLINTKYCKDTEPERYQTPFPDTYISIVYDLVIEDEIIRTLLTIPKNARISTSIKTNMLPVWNIPEDELFACAIQNTRENDPLCITDLDRSAHTPPDYLYKYNLVGQEITERIKTLVINTKERHNAAIALFYPETDAEIRRILGTDYYLMPSSIHEWIAVTTEGFYIQGAKETVTNINDTTVKCFDQLSDNIYQFHDGKLTMVPVEINAL